MAHQAKISSLTDELVELVAGYSPVTNARAFKTCKDAALKSLRHHRFGRTNQFNVKNSLEGLIEKFEIFNNAPLADALRTRLDELSLRATKWTPEILSLLLCLSDNPTENTNINDLEAPEPLVPEIQLSWKEIVADDPLPNDGVWDDVDFADHTSEEDLDDESESSSDHRDDTISTLVTEENNEPRAESLIEKGDDGAYRSLENVQTIYENPGRGQRSFISELRIIRESLNMLRGIPSLLFGKTRTGKLTAGRSHKLESVSESVLDSMLEDLAQIGIAIDSARMFARRAQQVPVLQRFSNSVQCRLTDFDVALASLEKRYVGIQGQVSVSLLHIGTEIRQNAEILLQLQEPIAIIREGSVQEALILLDMLFYKTSDLRSIGNNVAFEGVGRVFLQCADIYMDHVRTWLDHGKLKDHDNTSFVALSTKEINLEDFWSDWYYIRKTTQGVQTPGFVQEVAKEIFSAGKSIAFLDLIGVFDHGAIIESDFAPCLDFDVVCSADGFLSVLPFSVQFIRSLHDSIKIKHQRNSILLRQALVEQCGFQDTVNAMEHIFLCKNGAVFDMFASTIFAKLDSRKPSWNSHYFVEDVARKTFGVVNGIIENNITVAPSKNAYRGNEYSLKAFSNILINYTVPWPVANIIGRNAFTTYQRVSMLLLQIRRARTVLDRHRIRPAVKSSASAATTLDKDVQAFRMRHRLLWFLSLLEDHITCIAVATSSHEFYRNVMEAEDLDAIILAHEQFIQTLERRCLLSKSSSSLYQAITSLLELSVLFGDSWASEKKDPMQSSGKDNDDGQFSDSDSDMQEDETADSQGKSKRRNATSSNATLTSTRIKHMHSQYRHLLSLLAAGLHSATRGEDGDFTWRILAEKLEWGAEIRHQRNYE